MNNRHVLSISLLCNGKKPDETKKCLDSLKTIKDRLDSEIIIVDTGCDENARRLIEQYADKVVDFKWCNDFAKARNAGLRECTGEWFMYVDDDEWFDDTTPIVEFFTSGEYKKYGHADYIQRNYLNKEGSEYEIFWVGRMTVCSDETHFTGKIHEYLDPLPGECKNIDAFVHHYGYVFKAEKDHYAKAIRNIRPLYEMIEQEPNNLHWYSQLVNELISISEIGRLTELCEGMIKQLKDADDPLANKVRADFYYGLLWADIHSYQYERAIDDFNTFRKDRRNNRVCQAALYFNVSTAYYEQKEYKNAVRYAEKYFDIYDQFHRYDDCEVRISKEASLSVATIFSHRHRLIAICTLMRSAIKAANIEEIENNYSRFTDISDDGSQFDVVCKELVDLFADHPFDERLIRYANDLLVNNDSAKHAMHYAMKVEENARKEKTDRFENLLRVFGKSTNGSNYYLHYMRMRYEASYGTDREKFIGIYDSLILLTNDFFNLDSSVWRIADEKDIDLGNIFKEIPFFKWQRAVDTYMEKHGGEDSRDVRKMMSRFDSDDDVRFRYFRLKTLETDIINAQASESATKLAYYCKQCVDFYKDIYKAEQFASDDEASVLPPQCMFAVRFNEALQNGRFNDCSGLYPPFDDALDKYIRQAWEKYQQSLSSDKRKKLLYSMNLNQSPDAVIKKIKSVLFYFSHFSDRILFIWHSDVIPEEWPETAKSDYMSLINKFKKDGWGLFDSSSEVSGLIGKSDALYGDDDRFLRAAKTDGIVLLKEDTSFPVTDQNIVFDDAAIPPGIPEGMNVIQETNPTDIAMYTQMLLLGRLSS